MIITLSKLLSDATAYHTKQVPTAFKKQPDEWVALQVATNSGHFLREEHGCEIQFQPKDVVDDEDVLPLTPEILDQIRGQYLNPKLPPIILYDGKPHLVTFVPSAYPYLKPYQHIPLDEEFELVGLTPLVHINILE